MILAAQNQEPSVTKQYLNYVYGVVRTAPAQVSSHQGQFSELAICNTQVTLHPSSFHLLMPTKLKTYT